MSDLDGWYVRKADWNRRGTSTACHSGVRFDVDQGARSRTENARDAMPYARRDDPYGEERTVGRRTGRRGEPLAGRTPRKPNLRRLLGQGRTRLKRDPDDPEASGERERGVDTQRGRYALGWLIEQDGTADLRTWAEHIAAWEEDAPLAEISRDRRIHMYSWLYFAFVPRLVQAGLLEYEDDVVRPADGVEQIGEYLANSVSDDS